MSKVMSLHHVVFGTYFRRNVIPLQYRRELYNYMAGIAKNIRCEIWEAGGISDHVHILLRLHQDVALSFAVARIKQSSSRWMGENPHFPKWEKWAGEYYAGSFSYKDIDTARHYVTTQDEHHLGRDFMSELQNLIEKSGLTWYPDPELDPDNTDPMK
ncbi:MAG: IS200/IS605 family transposase [Bacteroidales bacterium]|nr:IS200/IS605 family transposase [Bacteroidales bacterium]